MFQKARVFVFSNLLKIHLICSLESLLSSAITGMDHYACAKAENSLTSPMTGGSLNPSLHYTKQALSKGTTFPVLCHFLNLYVFRQLSHHYI